MTERRSVTLDAKTIEYLDTLLSEQDQHHHDALVYGNSYVARNCPNCIIRRLINGRKA